MRKRNDDTSGPNGNAPLPQLPALADPAPFRKNATGLKRWHVPGREKEGVLTPYALKELRRRRKAGKAARLARRVSRA